MEKNQTKISGELILLFSITLLIFSISWSFLFSNDNELYHISLVFITLYLYIQCIITWVKGGGGYISIYVIFISYALFSNLGQSLLYVFGFSASNLLLYRNYSFIEITRVLRFQMICIAALHLGSALAIIRNRSISKKSVLSDSFKSQSLVAKNSEVGFFLNIALLLSISYVLFYAIYQILLRRNLTYEELYFSRESLYQIPYFLSIFLGIRSIIINKYRLFIYSVWGFLVILFFIAGTRSLAIVYIAVMLPLLSMTHPHLFLKRNLIPWIIIGLLFFGLISVTSITRQYSININNIFDFNVGFFRNITNTIAEMGSSARPIIYTMRWIDQGGQKYQTFLYSFFHGFIPTNVLSFFSEEWSIHLGSWINQYAQVTWTQYGYSFIAESYMNLGWWGWLFMIAYGWLISKGEIFAYNMISRGKLFIPSIILSILGKQVFFARAHFGLILSFYRMSVYLLVVWLFWRELSLINKNISNRSIIIHHKKEELT